LGELLVEDRLITAAQLEAALALQSVATSYVPLGQLLITAKALTRKQLTAALARYKNRSRLGEILLKSGDITDQQLRTALACQQHAHIRLGEALIKTGYITERHLRDALCTQLHINFFDLDPIPMSAELRPLMNERFATRHLIVPLFRVKDIVVVAMDDPTNLALIEEMQVHLRVEIEVVTAMREKISHALERLYGKAGRKSVNVFGSRNILVGPIRDPLVAELAARVLPVQLLPPRWQ
jgi:hypothetical protein